jgi:hypothetical protein
LVATVALDYTQLSSGFDKAPGPLYQFRFNGRENQELFAAVILNLVIKVALPYKVLTGETAKPVSSDPLPPSDEPF